MKTEKIKYEYDDAKHERRKKWLIQNTGLSIGNYINATILTAIAIFLGITSMGFLDIAILGGTGIVISLVIILIITKKKHITPTFSAAVLFGQYMYFLVIYGIWAVALNEARFISLFIVVISILFVVIAADFKQAIAIVLFIAAVHIGAVLYGVLKLGQKVSLTVDLFMAGCFILCGIMVSFIAGRFSKQRRGLHDAKKRAEDANRQLWGEMQLARKIQTVLLPDKPEIRGFEIAAYMMPADEVGGDYYDVINVEGRDWVVIGDVSGHGVSAGLIMMIVQTAVKMALAQSPVIEPSQLLSLINKTISQDIKKISEDKYMTITVLALYEEGRFFFSGLHQDIIIYRAADESVDIVETDGMWLGIMGDISGMLKDDSVTIDINDVMVVFTDGITEAWRDNSQPGKRDPEMDMYGQQRIVDNLKKNGKNDPEVIKTAILESMAEYSTSDDITLLVLKRVN